MFKKNDKKNVSTGKPKIGGSVFVAPVGTELPKDTTTPLNEAFKCLGYCSEDGITNENKISTEKVKAWGGDTVVNALDEKEDTFKTKLIESLNEDVLKTVYGAENISGTIATGLTVKVNNTQPEDNAFVFEMILKGGAIKRIVIPQASISEMGEIVYKDKDPIGYELTLMALPDEEGNTHYEYIKKGA